jgi:CDP-glucose 4,6-dehydratase
MINEAIAILRESPGPILITGHTGFKGAWLSLLLEELGIKAVGYSLPPDKNSMYQRLNRRGAITEVFADINDKKKLGNFFAATRPSFVIHLAAQPLVLESYKSPFETFETNVMGTFNVIEASFHSKDVKAVGVVTTDKVYRNTNSGKRFIESDPLEGKDPYSASKVAAESVINSWSNIRELTGGPFLASLRAGNVIGGGDFASDRLMPDLVRGLISKEIVEIRNIGSTRPWQHVLDPLFGYLVAVAFSSKNASNDSFNFGPDEPSYAVSELLEIVAHNFPNRIKVKMLSEVDPKIEAKSLDLDSSHAKKVLSWNPVWNQEQAVISTVDWWINCVDGNMNPVESSKQDIELLMRSYQIS